MWACLFGPVHVWTHLPSARRTVVTLGLGGVSQPTSVVRLFSGTFIGLEPRAWAPRAVSDPPELQLAADVGQAVGAVLQGPSGFALPMRDIRSLTGTNPFCYSVMAWQVRDTHASVFPMWVSLALSSAIPFVVDQAVLYMKSKASPVPVPTDDEGWQLIVPHPNDGGWRYVLVAPHSTSNQVEVLYVGLDGDIVKGVHHSRLDRLLTQLEVCARTRWPRRQVVRSNPTLLRLSPEDSRMWASGAGPLRRVWGRHVSSAMEPREVTPLSRIATGLLTRLATKEI
jgi:hypothetical protein